MNGGTMLIDAQIVTPYLVVILTFGLGVMGFYFRSITNKLATLSQSLIDLALKIAVLVEHDKDTDFDITEIKKFHTEIIDLKLASSELNERSKNNSRRINNIIDKIDVVKDPTWKQ